jgi:CheY-like chemotaxis protein
MATSQSRLRDATDARHAPLARPLVLVVDDDADTRFLFRTMLEIRGYRVIEAVDGEETVQQVESARPDLILIDASLPRVSGLDATRRIRRSGASSSVPIVFISGHAEASFLELAREAGGDDYLVKPITLAQLDRVLEKYLDQSARAFAI